MDEMAMAFWITLAIFAYGSIAFSLIFSLILRIAFLKRTSLRGHGLNLVACLVNICVFLVVGIFLTSFVYPGIEIYDDPFDALGIFLGILVLGSVFSILVFCLFEIFEIAHILVKKFLPSYSSR